MPEPPRKSGTPPGSGDKSSPGNPNDSGDKAPKPLTPEEQMERYEDALKEEDWGHQPC